MPIAVGKDNGFAIDVNGFSLLPLCQHFRSIRSCGKYFSCRDAPIPQGINRVKTFHLEKNGCKTGWLIQELFSLFIKIKNQKFMPH
jgi:hypothetical protein